MGGLGQLDFLSFVCDVELCDNIIYLAMVGRILSEGVRPMLHCANVAQVAAKLLTTGVAILRLGHRLADLRCVCTDLKLLIRLRALARRQAS